MINSMSVDIEKYFNEGRDFIADMGEKFKPYLEVCLRNKIKDRDEVITLFGYYLSKAKVDAEGYKLISKFSFQNFVIEFLYGVDVNKVMRED